MAVVDVSKEAWLQALESGKFEQTQGGMARVSDPQNLSFCCLGVMCEIAPNTTSSYKPHIQSTEFASYEIEQGILIIDNLEYFSPKWMSTDQMRACVYANDTLNWTFAQIAEWWRETDGAVKVYSKAMYGLWAPDYTLDEEREA